MKERPPRPKRPELPTPPHRSPTQITKAVFTCAGIRKAGGCPEKQKVDRLLEIINDDQSLDTFEECVDILEDMNHAYNVMPKLGLEIEALIDELNIYKKALNEIKTCGHGHTNPGYGYTCSRMAGKAIEEGQKMSEAPSNLNMKETLFLGKRTNKDEL